MLSGSGAGHGSFRGHVDFVAGNLFRDLDGRFNTFQREAAAANRDLSIKMQKAVAQALRQGLKRPGVSTGLLSLVTSDRRNRYADQFGFGVGLPDYLDESAAKYWYQIEEGTDVHVGQRMGGVWTNAIDHVGPDYVKGVGESQRAIAGELFQFGAGKGQAFIPLGRSRGRRALRYQNPHAPYRERHRVSGIIRRRIQAENYYQRGWEEFNPMRTVEAEYDRIFRDIGFQVRWVQGRSSPQLIKRPLPGADAAARRRARGV